MPRTDEEIRARLERATAWMEIDTERALERVRGSEARSARSRRTGTIAIAAVVLAVVAVALVWQRTPQGGGFVTEGLPSGRLIVGTRLGARDGEPNTAFVLDVATRTRQPIDADGNITAMQWSPDRSRIAYTVERDEGARYALVVARPDGSEPVTLVEHEKAEGTLGPDFVSVAWSPDGSRIAYSGRTIYRGRTVTLLSARGGGEHVLDGHWESVRWSPDGRDLLLSGWPDGAPPDRIDLYRADADGRKFVRLTDDPLPEFSASWSPDGAMIAFARFDSPEPDANPDVYVMRADGSDERRITDGFGFDGVPVWSPDGRWIAFASDADATPEQRLANLDPDVPGGATSIYVMRPDGSDARILLDGAGDVMFPWSWGD